MSEDRLARLTLAVGERDHIQGPATAPVTLVEYGDYECPYCRAAVPIVRELQQLLGEQLRYVFRHFPLTASPPHAQQAAEVSEAAAVQGRFFEMHSLDDIDLVIEGSARRVTEPSALERVAALYRDQGWPAEVAGDALTAPYSAPSAGPAPWYLYEIEPVTVFGVATTEPGGAMRWRFSRRPW